MSKLIRQESTGIEKASDGRFRIRVIRAGEGSSGFYPREVLERDGSLAFPAGTKIFANHPSMQEEWDQPERDITKMVGKLTGDSIYEDGSLFAEVKFAAWFMPVVEEFKDELGMSIYAFAESEFGTVGEYTGDVITSFPPAGHPNLNSVDVVTAAGAGGAILERITESFKRKPKVKESEPTATSAEDEERGTELTKEIVDAVDKLGEGLTGLTAKVEALLAAKKEEVQAEANAEAVDKAVKERFTAFAGVAESIDKAEIFDYQKQALRESAQGGKDITQDLEVAVNIAKQAREAAAGDKTPRRESYETGRFGESFSSTKSSDDDKPVDLTGVFR